ncbi:radical SAM family heme chaperone HemW [Rickettsiales bacterium]|nr:radical SAM family heme chaperone HemW [Rickettsiales bacterium]
MPNNLAIYVHWPFCLSKCPYCDFNSHVSNDINENLWQQAYLFQIDKYSELLSTSQITSIFFGGGTPSLMPPFIAESIISKIQEISAISSDIEITLEANPTSIEIGKFIDFKNAGINRVSVGVQALNDIDLKFLGRQHNVKNALNALDTARKIFSNYSFDLIYARPGQTVEQWNSELELALKHASSHISLYQLTIEKGTEFFNEYRKRKFELPNEEISAQLYELTNKKLGNENFEAYEISNYAKKGFESKHNLTYWNYEDYLGIGPGAHSRINKKAISMIYNPQKYLSLINQNKNPIQQEISLSAKEQLAEMLLMGLRLNKGISWDKIERFSNKSKKEIIKHPQIKNLNNAEFIEIDENNLKISNKGRVLSNQIIEKIVDCF